MTIDLPPDWPPKQGPPALLFSHGSPRYQKRPARCSHAQPHRSTFTHGSPVLVYKYFVYVVNFSDPQYCGGSPSGSFWQKRLHQRRCVQDQSPSYRSLWHVALKEVFSLARCVIEPRRDESGKSAARFNMYSAS